MVSMENFYDILFPFDLLACMVDVVHCMKDRKTNFVQIRFHYSS
jgi:hypothetical protein